MNLLLFAVSDVAETILYILLALVVLLVMITIHEAGHYTAGKILGFKINEFAIGMGPKLFSRKKKNGEVFSVRLFPLGGYCAFEGEDENMPDSPDAFNSQKPWKRIIVLVSGALFNFISAILIVFIAFWAFGDDALAIQKVYESSVNYDAYQQGTGFKEGDIIYKIDGKVVYLVVDVSNYIAGAGDEMDVVVLRENAQGKREKVTIENVRKGKFTVDKLDENGNVVLGDEMLTPDSSRFWPLEGYEPGHSQPSFDKQFVRDWLKANPDSNYDLPQDVIDKTIAKYLEAYELLTGKKL